MSEALLVIAAFTVTLSVLASLLRGGILRGIATILLKVAIRLDAMDQVLSDLARPFLREMWRGASEMFFHYRALVRQYSREMAEERER